MFDDFMTSLSGVFQYMEWAEEVISEFASENQKYFDVINKSFYILRPILYNPTEVLYKHHARELLSRVINGEEVCLATTCELLHVFSETSLLSPLTYDATNIYTHLFREVYPDKYEEFFGEHPMRESWDGQVVETLNSLRWKYRQDRYK